MIIVGVDERGAPQPLMSTDAPQPLARLHPLPCDGYGWDFRLQLAWRIEEVSGMSTEGFESWRWPQL